MTLCPSCESADTERQATMYEEGAVQVVRVCHDCPTQFTVTYGDPVIEEVATFEEGADE